MSLRFLPSNADAMKKESKRRRLAGNKRRGVLLNLLGHMRTSEPLEVSLHTAITSASTNRQKFMCRRRHEWCPSRL